MLSHSKAQIFRVQKYMHSYLSPSFDGETRGRERRSLSIVTQSATNKARP